MYVPEKSYLLTLGGLTARFPLHSDVYIEKSYQWDEGISDKVSLAQTCTVQGKPYQRCLHPTD